MQRTNSELVAGWGNLVNRTASMIAKSFGEIPAPGPLEPVDQEILDEVARGFDTVGDLIAHHRQKAGIAEAMRIVGEVNAYVSRTEPFKLKGEDQRERLGTVLHTLAQCVHDCNTILAPFLPHASNRVWATFGGEGEFMPMPRIEHVEDLGPVTTAAVDPSIASDELRVYPIITGEYSSTPRWERRPVTVGAPVAKPTPVFVKLDPCVVEEEMARMTGASGADTTAADTTAADTTGDVAAAPAQGGAQA